MSSYKRLAADVDHTEEAEIRRLEGDTGKRRRLDVGAARDGAARDTSACSAVAAPGAGAVAAATGSTVDHAARPLLGAVEGKVLAPRLVNRTACLVESISKFKWRVAAGEAVAHFLAATDRRRSCHTIGTR